MKATLYDHNSSCVSYDDMRDVASVQWDDVGYYILTCLWSLTLLCWEGKARRGDARRGDACCLV